MNIVLEQIRLQLQAYAESSMRLYHTLMLEVVSSTLKKSMAGGPFRG